MAQWLAGSGQAAPCGYRSVRFSGHAAAQRKRLRLSFALERLENRFSRTALLHAFGFDSGISDRVHPSPRQAATGGYGGAAMARYLPVYRRARRTVFSRLGAEPARTPRRTASGVGDSVGDLWTITLQQALSAFQLALCVAGNHRRDFLWTRIG